MGFPQRKQHSHDASGTDWYLLGCDEFGQYVTERCGEPGGRGNELSVFTAGCLLALDVAVKGLILYCTAAVVDGCGCMRMRISRSLVT